MGLLSPYKSTRMTQDRDKDQKKDKNQNRDHQLVAAFVKLTPTLRKIFMRNIQKHNGDKAKKVEDLLQITAEKALLNSREAQYSKYTCECLVWQKAFNVLFTFVQSCRRQPVPLVGDPDIASQSPNPYKSLLSREFFNYLNRYAGSLTYQICFLIGEGWSYKEIGRMLNISEGQIKMRIHRLKLELRSTDLKPD